MKARQFAYLPHPRFPGGMPCLDLNLSHQERIVSVSALVDSGAALNILPFDIGLELGLVWETQTFPINLEGTLTGTHAYAVILYAELTTFPVIELAFAWVNKPRPEIRVLLGQVNFFQEFNMYFYGHQQTFEITPRPGRLSANL